MSRDHRARPGITELLIAWSTGQEEALAKLLPEVYEELRRIAAARLRHEAPGHTLQPTALVHEAYLRLANQRRIRWRNRAQFYGVAAQIMRRILVDEARSRHAEKRGGQKPLALAVSTGDRSDHDSRSSSSVDVIGLHEALERLATFDPQQARIVELRYFGGLTIEETAEAVRVSPATVAREWTIARAWLRAELTK